MRTLSKLAPLFFFLAVNSQLSAGERLSRTQLLMGDIPVSITIETSSRRKAEAFEAMSLAFAEVRRIESEVSEWRRESQTSLLNRHAGKAFVPIGRDLLEILLKAAQVSCATGGAFDITFPSNSKAVSHRDVIVWPELGLATLRRGVRIAVSGIAKGYIVDAVTDLLRRRKFSKFLVNAGDIYGSGLWEVEIRDPDDPRGAATVCRLSIRNQAVSTSGQYERGGHLIDPRNGRSVSSWRSLTVVAGDSMTADALATGLFILAGRGGDSMESALQQLEGIGGVVVDRNGGTDIFGGVTADCSP